MEYKFYYRDLPQFQHTWQPVQEEKSEFDPVLLHFKIDFVSHLVHGGTLSETVNVAGNGIGALISNPR